MERSKLYFDFDAILEPIKNRSAKSVEVMKPPVGKLYGKKLLISGEFDRRQFRRYIHRQAHRLEMHGNIKELEDNQVEIIIVSKNKQDVNNFKENCYKAVLDDEKIEKIDEMEWNKPIQIGFSVIQGKELSKSEIKDLVTTKERLEKENEKLTKRYKQINRSRAWRATYPIRITLQSIKHAVRRIKD